MKEINPIYVTFEQAKSFYNKGLEREVLGIKPSSVQKPYYNDKGELNGDCSEHIKKILNYEKSILYPAPEQWQVVEFLRVNHNIFIQVVAEVYADGINYLWNTINLAKDESTPWHGDNGEYNTPQEAYSTAFDYILQNNLI